MSRRVISRLLAFGGVTPFSSLNINTLNPVLICRRPNRDVVASCKWQLTFGNPPICSSVSPAHLRWIADVFRLAWNSNQIGTIFNHSICTVWNCGRKLSCLENHCGQKWSRLILRSSFADVIPSSNMQIQPLNLISIFRDLFLWVENFFDRSRTSLTGRYIFYQPV